MLDIKDHYWIVTGSSDQVWSSAAALASGVFSDGFIAPPTSNPVNGYTRIANETELRELQIAIVSGLDVLNRLTSDEYAALRAAEAANPATMGRWLDALRVNGQINLFGYTAEAARTGLVQAGLLSVERAAIVFAPVD